MSGGYNPKVEFPHMSNNIPQMRSGEFQKPFFFGGAQAPTALGIRTTSAATTPTGKGLIIHSENKQMPRGGMYVKAGKSPSLECL